MNNPKPVKIDNGYWYQMFDAKGEPINLPYGVDVQHYLDKGFAFAMEKPEKAAAKKGGK